jgi:hypothetical protein
LDLVVRFRQPRGLGAFGGGTIEPRGLIRFLCRSGGDYFSLETKGKTTNNQHPTTNIQGQRAERLYWMFDVGC